MQTRKGNISRIWLALAVALGLHAIILFIPISSQTPLGHDTGAQIELQLTTFSPQPHTIQPPVQEPKIARPERRPEPLPEPVPEPVATKPEVDPGKPEPPMSPHTLKARELKHDLDNMSGPEISRLTNAILSRQFTTEEPAIERIFGMPFEQHSSELQQEFHYPLRQDMISMLDQPMPDVPFAYTPGLIKFAYDPGVKGDLQRFWDVITPEFGWRTKNGTEFKCIWVLIIAGCGWK